MLRCARAGGWCRPFEQLDGGRAGPLASLRNLARALRQRCHPARVPPRRCAEQRACRRVLFLSTRQRPDDTKSSTSDDDPSFCTDPRPALLPPWRTTGAASAAGAAARCFASCQGGTAQSLRLWCARAAQTTRTAAARTRIAARPWPRRSTSYATTSWMRCASRSPRTPSTTGACARLRVPRAPPRPACAREALTCILHACVRSFAQRMLYLVDELEVTRSDNNEGDLRSNLRRLRRRRLTRDTAGGVERQVCRGRRTCSAP
jgi:hypothetical protein